MTTKLPASDFLGINLKIKASDAFKDGELTPEELEELDEDFDRIEPPKFVELLIESLYVADNSFAAVPGELLLFG